MSKFTPGPWKAFVSADVASVVKNKQGLGIARVIDDYDAYLIAAAPAIYEALQKAVEWIEDARADDDYIIEEWYHEAIAALRTADGGE